MVCFCDIPLGRLTEHVAFYGSYGLGMSKDWGISHGLSPLSYVNTKSVHAEAIASAASSAYDSRKGSDEDYNDVVQMLAFTKPLNGIVNRKDGSAVEKDFYSECEWRYMPKFAKGNKARAMSERFYKDQEKLVQYNNEMKAEFTLAFRIDDIKYILLKDEAEVPVMHDFISTNPELGENSVNEIKRLTTRIISLPRLVRDI
jgi:hypothetical protein